MNPWVKSVNNILINPFFFFFFFARAFWLHKQHNSINVPFICGTAVFEPGAGGAVDLWRSGTSWKSSHLVLRLSTSFTPEAHTHTHTQAECLLRVNENYKPKCSWHGKGYMRDLKEQQSQGQGLSPSRESQRWRRWVLTAHFLLQQPTLGIVMNPTLKLCSGIQSRCEVIKQNSNNHDSTAPGSEERLWNLIVRN